jgi:hypothetical protein
MIQYPQELFDQICDHLPAEDLRSTYYVSTKFRKAAEDLAHKHRRDSHEVSKDENMDKVIDHYSGFQLRYLKHLKLNIRFPVSEDEDRGCHETTEERYERDKIFTEQVQWIFTKLKTMEDRAGEKNCGNYRLTLCVNYRVDGYCMHRQHAQWRTQLMEPETLPELNSVSSLYVLNDVSSVKLEYRILIDLACRLPNLEHLECHMGQDEWNPSYPEEPASLFKHEYDGPRRDARYNFGEAFTSTADVLKSLQSMELDFLCREVMTRAESINHWKAQPNLVGPLSKDPFSSSLRIMSYHVTEMAIRAQIDDTLFWPGDGFETPHWPNLQYFFLMFHMVSPSGAWYFEGPKGEGRDLTGYDVNKDSYPPLGTTGGGKTDEDDEDEEDEDEEDEDDEDNEHDEDEEDVDCHEVTKDDPIFDDDGSFSFRISPNENVMVPFLTSFAKAAIHMPKLRRYVLWSPLKWDVDGNDSADPAFDYYEPPGASYNYRDCLAWGLAYYAPNEGRPFDINRGENNSKSRQLWWKVGEWRPSKELHDSFQRIGRREHGEDMKEYCDDEEFGQGLVHRGYFDFLTPDETVPDYVPGPHVTLL